MCRRSIPALVILLIAVACGGSSATSDSVEDGFARRATAVCVSALADKHAEGTFPYPDFNPTRPDPTKLAGVATFLEKTATTFTSWHERMVALGEPKHGGEAWHHLLAAINTHVRLTRDQIAAARSGDTQQFADDYQEGVDTQARLLDAAQAAGVPQCADVDR
jgi:hypothetical protein